MKQNDIERKTSSLDFDKETEMNGAKARLSQGTAVIKSKIQENNKAFEQEFYPLKLAQKAYADKEKELKNKKADELLRAELIFFFQFDNKYIMIPDDITNRIIQGLGNKVFTKTFRVEVPHDGFRPGEIEFKVLSLVNYGDVKLYKCGGEIFGEKINIYIDKTEELQLGSVIKLEPDFVKCQIYEDELNVRLY